MVAFAHEQIIFGDAIKHCAPRCSRSLPRFILKASGRRTPRNPRQCGSVDVVARRGGHRFLFSEPAVLDELAGQLKTVQAIVQRWQKNI
jgi:hypothetical protein